MTQDPNDRIAGIVGTEVEYGLSWANRTPEDPERLSAELIGHIPEACHAPVLWDYENEDPRHDARGFLAEGERKKGRG